MNKKILTGALAALTLGGALAATAMPAAAYDRGWHGGGWHGDRGYGYAGAALLGLGVGAALAGGSPAYYAPPPCRVELRWNPYWRGYDRVRVCY
jgi:hypothetical protein